MGLVRRRSLYFLCLIQFSVGFLGSLAIHVPSNPLVGYPPNDFCLPCRIQSRRLGDLGDKFGAYAVSGLQCVVTAPVGGVDPGFPSAALEIPGPSATVQAPCAKDK